MFGAARRAVPDIPRLGDTPDRGGPARGPAEAGGFGQTLTSGAGAEPRAASPVEGGPLSRPVAMYNPFAPRPSLWKGALAGLAGGLVGTFVKSQAEPLLQKLGEDLFPPSHREKEQPGADVTGHPDRMPPATMAQEVTDEAGVTLSRDQKLTAQEGIHWAFGTTAGVAYGVAAEFTAAEAGLGVPAAVALFGATHGTTLPALGLQADLDELPKAWWVWEFGSHLVYGLTVELVRRGVRSALD